MAVGGGGELDLAALGQRAVAGDQAAQDLAHQRHEPLPVLESETLALRHQLGQRRLPSHLGFARPDQVIPDQDVGEIGAGEIARRPALAVEQLVQFLQALVARIGRHHALMVAGKAAGQHQAALGLVHAIQVFPRQQAQQGIAEGAGFELARVILDLVEQHRHEIHHRPHSRMVLQVRRHVGVVLEGVQVGPRPAEFAAGEVPVIRLVHVPEKDQLELA